MNHPKEFAALFKLPIEQRLQLVHDLWDSIADEEAALPIPDWQIEELKRRAAAYDAGETTTYTWEEVQKMMAEDK